MFTTAISPEKILSNKKLMLSLMFTGIGIAFISWAVTGRLKKKNISL